MTKELYTKYLKFFLYFASVYMLGEALVHLSGIRATNLENYTSVEIKNFFNMFLQMWGVATLFFAGLFYEMGKDLKKYRQIILLFGLICLPLALVLLKASFTPFEKTLPSPAMFLWIPFYSKWLKVESLLLISGFLYILYGKHKKYL